MMSLTDTNVASKSVFNYYIEIYRFMLMLWIVLIHYAARYPELGLDKIFYFPFTFENERGTRVSLFFMVSGFFMAKALMKNDSGFCVYGQYATKRYLRLWIPYAIACIFIYIWLEFLPVEGRTVDFTTLIANVACIIHPGFERVDNEYWFLADLLTVQLILGLFLFIKNDRSRKLFVNILFVIVMVAQVITPPVLSGFSKELFEVLLGVQLCMMEKYKDIRSVFLFVIGLMVVCFNSIELFVGVLLFLLLVYWGKKVPPSNQNLQHFLKYAGSISFYWYLVHQNIGYSIMYYIIPNGSTNEFWLLVPMGVTLFLFAPLVYLLDKKFSKLLFDRIPFLKK